MTSAELTGGAGFTFEDAVTAWYLAALVTGTTATGLDGRVVTRVAQQQADFGEPLDDVIVDAELPEGSGAMRLSLQAKSALTISSAESNSDFKEIIQRSWQTLSKPDFREHIDRVGAATGNVATQTSRAFITVCEWARASDTTEVFAQRLRGGSASDTHRDVALAVRTIAEATGRALDDAELHRLFAHLVLIRLDFLHAGSTHEGEAIANLQRSLAPTEVNAASDLWNLLRQLARDGDGRSATHTRASLLRSLPGWRFVGSPALQGDLRVLRDSTRQWLDQQPDDIGGTHLDRKELRISLGEQIATHRLTLIKGLPGTGKTVLFRDLVAEFAVSGTTLLLTSSRLTGASWPEYARAIGLTSISLDVLLTEIAASGQATLFIDGIDRIPPGQRGVITDLLGQLVVNPMLSGWRIVGTARDTGIEPLRNWMPSALFLGGGVGYVDVGNLSDDEAAVLSLSLPALRPLLSDGNERVRELARRPFFAAVLARGLSNAAYPSGFAPQSEVDLIAAWWSRGGYNSDKPEAQARQRCLIEMAELSAHDLGRNAYLRAFTSTSQSALSLLVEDGLVQPVRAGHTVRFSHDIFFEWSFLHVLLDQGNDWISALTKAGEPPGLARVVELLSQVTYPNSVQWTRDLTALEEADVRPQWLRAWLIAPVFHPEFRENVEAFADAVVADDFQRFQKLLVWMQAEKTTPNPHILSGALGGELSAAERIRLADSLGWPSDFSAWRRLLLWAMTQTDAVPKEYLRDLVTLFETWQIAVADYRNDVSQGIITLTEAWLIAIENENAHRRFSYRGQKGDSASAPRVHGHLETELRALVLRAGRSYPQNVERYLNQVVAIERWPEKAFGELVSFSPILAQSHPDHLTRLVRRCLLRELPDDAVARRHREDSERMRRLREVEAKPPESRSQLDELFLESEPRSHHSFSDHDWDQLAVGGDHQGFFPPSPEREPFASLLQHNVESGLALIRDITNHAVSAWRQLHTRRPRSGIPLPLRIRFPWGQQEFWGEDRHYGWFRGHGGPQAVECAQMALERWAIAQLDAGLDLDELLERLLAGQTSISVLGIAAHLAVRGQRTSPATLALLSSFRLLRLDMRRVLNEREYSYAGLIGFDMAGLDPLHRKAVAESTTMKSRGLELRDLVPVFILGSDTAMRDACRTALDGFPENLDFAYQEEEADEDRLIELRRTADLWAELGHIENYSINPVAGRDDAVQVSMNSPLHDTDEVKAVRRRSEELNAEAELWLWVDKCFKSRAWSPEFSPDDAVMRASKLANVLFAHDSDGLMSTIGLVESAVAGTAAAVICFARASGHETWANETIEKFRIVEDEPSDEMHAASSGTWHPKVFVAFALSERIVSGGEVGGVHADLLRLIANSMHEVSFAAMAGVARCWEVDERFAWSALNLGLRLAQFEHTPRMFSGDLGERKKYSLERRAEALALAVAEYAAVGPLPELVAPRASWIRLDVPKPVAQGRTREWQKSTAIWDGRFAANVLKRVPIARAMSGAGCAQFIDALQSFVAWTLDAVNPPWRGGARESGEDHLYEWQAMLAQTMAAATSHCDASEVVERWLTPILAQPDEIAMRLLAPFTEALVCSDVFDAPSVNDDVVRILDVVLSRTIQCRDLLSSHYADGRISGFDLPKMIKSLLFVVVEDAPGAARFANGAWDDLGVVMPLVDRMVRSVGWHPYVIRQFLRLCERSGAAYPTETLADQLLVLIVDGHFPRLWKGSTTPATIAALVQAHADRHHPLDAEVSRKWLRVLDALVDLGDRRSAALQQSESFRGVRVATIR